MCPGKGEQVGGFRSADILGTSDAVARLGIASQIDWRIGPFGSRARDPLGSHPRRHSPIIQTYYHQRRRRRRVTGGDHVIRIHCHKIMPLLGIVRMAHFVELVRAILRRTDTARVNNPDPCGHGTEGRKIT